MSLKDLGHVLDPTKQAYSISIMAKPAQPLLP